MIDRLQPIRITDHVHWVGAIDWGLRDFHGYLTGRGTTYNAYLILADQVTLIDTVKSAFADEMLARISSLVDPRRIDCVVSNHAELDHSGALPRLLAVAAPERIIASARGVAALQEHFHFDADILGVKDGDTVSLGNLTLSFVETPMLHWPESMFTYLPQERVLFSNDAFGMHLATSERFEDEVDPCIVRHEAAKYFANILMPLAPLVTRLLDKVGKLDLDLDTIATSHGPIWRREPTRALDNYARWAAQRPTNKAVVVYDTMWHSTEMMAQAIGDGLAAGGARVKLMPLKASHRSDVALELLDAGALVVGSPSINNGILPTVADVLTYLKGLKPRNLVGAAFGSYGWSGDAVEQVTAALLEMQVELVGDGLKVKFVPDGDALRRCVELGRAVAERIQGLGAGQ